MFAMNMIAFTGGIEWLWVLLAILLLFGGRKLPGLAKSMGSSITQFKKGLREDDEPKALDDKSNEG
jgi:sec-independent protein translocase protein TatA